MEIDGAIVLMISEKGHYGYIRTLGSSDKGVEVCYLAICKYAESDRVYLFSCDNDMGTESDFLVDSVEEAIAIAQSRSSSPITWLYPVGRS